MQYIHSYRSYLEAVSSILKPTARHIVLTGTHITQDMFTSVPILSQMHPVHTFPPYGPNIHYNIILP